MKQKILDILNKHKWQPVNTYLTSDVITEEEFEAVAEDIDKLLATPAVSKCEGIEREATVCSHPREHRIYIGRNTLRCGLCGLEFE
jgi:hypothetical protein